MPSRSGGLIKEKFERLLRRDLTRGEVLRCEELALNMFVGPVLSYLERLAKKPMKHDFDSVAAAIGNTIKDAVRSQMRKHELTGRLEIVYKKLDLFHPGMTDGEMSAVVTLADKYTDAEIDRAIVSARSRGAIHVRYVLGVCVGNQGKPTARPKAKIKVSQEHVLRPSSDVVSAAWDRALERAADKELENKMERGFLD